MFIKLTAFRDGKTALYLRADLIGFVHVQADGSTHIQFANKKREGYAVTETPEQIMEMIKNLCCN